MKTQSGTFYRILFADNLHNVLTAVRNPEGRFHHQGQQALYTSCTPEGARLALGYYAQPDDRPRLIVELNVNGADLFDLRDETACAELSITYDDATVRWQNERSANEPATTWRVSDAVRASGADGMYYPSSSWPDVFHMVLFRWNSLAGAVVQTTGPPTHCDLI